MDKEKETPQGHAFGICNNTNLPTKRVSQEVEYCNQRLLYCSKTISLNSINASNTLAWLNTQREIRFFTKQDLALAIGVTPYQARKILYELKERLAVDYKYLRDKGCYQLYWVYPLDPESYCPFEFANSCEDCPLIPEDSRRKGVEDDF